MSQDQATQSKNTKNEPAQTNSVRHSFGDPMAREEIKTSFDESPSRAQSDSSQSKDTSSFRLGLAQAFAQEEEIQEDFAYVPPAQLVKVQEFMSVFDFSDKNDAVRNFETVSSVHHDILTVQSMVNNMSSQPLSFQARQQLQHDLYLLETFAKQTSAYMEETRPTY